jgi:hypothetical protein
MTMNLVFENPTVINLFISRIGFKWGKSKDSAFDINIKSDPPMHLPASVQGGNAIVNASLTMSAGFSFYSLGSLVGDSSLFGPFIVNSTDSVVSVATAKLSVFISATQTATMTKKLINLLPA